MKKPLLLYASLIIATLSFAAYGESDVHTKMGHIRHENGASSKAAEQSIKLSVVNIKDNGQKKWVQIRLTKVKDNSPVGLEALKEVHTQKIHLLIIDDSLTDYSHIHPKATADKGVYEFEWNPTKVDAPYRIWADLFPLETNAQEYAIADLTASNQPTAEIDRTVSMQSAVGGMTFNLTFDTPDLQVGKSAMGKIMITDDKRNPVKNLEPIMGAYGHIVGFGDDLKGVIHIHPMGDEPTKDTDRGGPELQFHIESQKAGFIKVFAQVSVQGKEFFAPFGIVVKESAKVME